MKVRKMTMRALQVVIRTFELHRRARILVGAVLVVSTTASAVLLHDTAYAAGTTFTYQGGEQTYTVPPGVTWVTINAVGAPGGTGIDDFLATDAGPGGGGASVTATVGVTPGQILYVEVGGPGSSPSTPPTTQASCLGSGPAFNGGGSGAACGGGGGGASDVQTCSITTCTDLTPDTRLVVAGGGGGGGGSDQGGTGGSGGDAGDQAVTGSGVGGTGCSTPSCPGGVGGDGGSGPPPGTSTCSAGAGSLGQGGGGQCGVASGKGNSGGGGGGYDGGGEGGSGTDGGGGGGAGSSYWVAGAVDTSMTDPAAPPRVTITPGPAASGSQVHAVIQVETSPSYAGDTVHISSSQLQDSCDGVITFETLQGGSTVAPRTSLDSIDVILDDDGNVTVVVDGADCAPGSDLIEADLTGAPYLTATTDLDVEPPQVTPVGVSATPADEVETGNSAASGNSDVYTIFYVETSPVYAEQPVTVSSPQLEDRCGQGWRWEPGSGTAIDQASGPTVATGTLDDDGNAVFAFKGASCAAGTSTVTADVDAGTHPTYTTTYTIAAPTVTLPAGSPPKTTHRRHHHRPRHGKGGTGSSDPPAMTVTASPDPLVETGAPTGGVPTVNVVKTDNYGGSSNPPVVPDISDNNGTITYTITVSNSGLSALDEVVVSDPLSSNSEITDDTFTATETGGASGFTPSATGAGYNDIDDTVDLPAGSTVTYRVVADLTNSICVIGLSNTVTLTPPAGAALSAGSNTTATDNDTGFIGAC